MKYFLLIAVTFSSFLVLAQEIQLPVPQDLRATLSKKGDRYFVDLSWEGRQPGDSLTESYFIFNNYPPSTKLYLNGKINRLNENQYSYEVKKPYAAEYIFAVKAVAMFPYEYESDLSDTIKVMVPSSQLPLPNNLKIEIVEEKRVSFSWTYQNILDLKNFKLLLDNREFMIPAERHSFDLVLDEPVKGGLKAVLIAISETGLKSPPREAIGLVEE